jgi:hypothetical protein
MRVPLLAHHARKGCIPLRSLTPAPLRPCCQAMEKVDATGDYKLHRGFKPIHAKYKGTG